MEPAASYGGFTISTDDDDGDDDDDDDDDDAADGAGPAGPTPSRRRNRRYRHHHYHLHHHTPLTPSHTSSHPSHPRLRGRPLDGRRVTCVCGTVDARGTPPLGRSGRSSSSLTVAAVVAAACAVSSVMAVPWPEGGASVAPIVSPAPRQPAAYTCEPCVCVRAVRAVRVVRVVRRAVVGRRRRARDTERRFVSCMRRVAISPRGGRSFPGVGFGERSC